LKAATLKTNRIDLHLQIGSAEANGWGLLHKTRCFQA